MKLCGHQVSCEIKWITLRSFLTLSVLTAPPNCTYCHRYVLTDSYQKIYKALDHYSNMVTNYIEHLSRYRDSLRDTVDEGTSHLMRGQYEEAKVCFDGISVPKGYIDRSRRDSREEWHVTAQIKRHYMRVLFGRSLSDGLIEKERINSSKLYHLHGFCFFIDEVLHEKKLRDNCVSDEEMFDLAGQGMAGLGLVEEGIQVLLDSKEKNPYQCIRNVTIRSRFNGRPQFSPSHFGRGESLSKLAQN